MMARKVRRSGVGRCSESRVQCCRRCKFTVVHGELIGRAGCYSCFFFFFQAEDGIRDLTVTGVQTCALPICGFDLSAPRRADEEVAVMTTLFRDTHVKLLTMPKPTIAMVNGHAIAGGLILEIGRASCRERV